MLSHAAHVLQAALLPGGSGIPVLSHPKSFQQGEVCALWEGN